MAIICERFFAVLILTAENGTKARASGEKSGGLARGEFERVLLAQIHATYARELEQFAFDHVLRDLDKEIEDAEIAFGERHLERLHVKPVSREDAHVIAPTCVGGGAA